MAKQELVVYHAAISRDEISALEEFRQDFALREPLQRVVSMMNLGGGTIVVVYEQEGD